MTCLMSRVPSSEPSENQTSPSPPEVLNPKSSPELKGVRLVGKVIEDPTRVVPAVVPSLTHNSSIPDEALSHT